MRFNVPLRIPETARVSLTQAFGVTSVGLEPKGPNGELHYHYGIDLVVGDDHLTYGTALVCPFPHGTVVSKTWDGPMNDKGNGLILDYTEPDGTKHELVAWHLSGIAEGTDFKEGETLGYLGNSGTVYPKPSLRDPYAGAHLHAGYKRNGVWTDPLQAFDISNPYIGADTGQVRDMPPADWVVQKILALLAPFGHRTADYSVPNPPIA